MKKNLLLICLISALLNNLSAQMTGLSTNTAGFNYWQINYADEETLPGLISCESQVDYAEWRYVLPDGTVGNLIGDEPTKKGKKYKPESWTCHINNGRKIKVKAVKEHDYTSWTLTDSTTTYNLYCRGNKPSDEWRLETLDESESMEIYTEEEGTGFDWIFSESSVNFDGHFKVTATLIALFYFLKL